MSYYYHSLKGECLTGYYVLLPKISMLKRSPLCSNPNQKAGNVMSGQSNKSLYGFIICQFSFSLNQTGTTRTGAKF